MKESESESETYDKNYHKLYSILSKEDIKEKLLHRFYFLKKQEKLEIFYGYKEDTQNKKEIIELWDKIIKYLLEEIFHCFAFTLSDIKKYLTINDKEPKNLNNIIQQLIIYQIYITNEDLKNDNYYAMYFPDLYPTKSLYTSIKSLIPSFNFGFCRNEENKQANEIENKNIREDLSKDDKIPENSIIFDYEVFKIHCNSLLMVLKDILHENNSEIIRKDHFIQNIKNNYVENDENSQMGRYKLRYGLQYINYAIHYLEKIKQILIFTIDSKYEFIKVSNNKDDSIKESDIEDAKLYLEKENN